MPSFVAININNIPSVRPYVSGQDSGCEVGRGSDLPVSLPSIKFRHESREHRGQSASFNGTAAC